MNLGKSALLPLLGLLFIISCKGKTPVGANGVEYKSPVQYNDYIVSRQTRIMKNIMKFAEVAQNNLDSADHLLDQYVVETGQMIREIKGMPPFKGDSSLRDAASGIFGFYRNIFDKDYRDIIHLRNEQDGTSMEVENQINDIVKKIETEEKGHDERFQLAQQNFARKNNMKLTENKMQKEFDEKLGGDQ